MRSRIFFTLLFFSFIRLSFSQDIIYRTDGTKFSAKVMEITPEEIKYKSAENPTGPNYVISREFVLLIEFKNGTVEVITPDPDSFSPDKTIPKEEQKKKTLTHDLFYLNKNTILLNGAALANADITAIYDREFFDGGLSLSVLGGYNFNLKTTWPNLFIRELEHSKKNYDLGVGANFYPVTGQKVQYYFGVLFKYMNFSYDKVNIGPNGGYTLERKSDYQLSTMVVNGLSIRITSAFDYKLFLGLGAFNARGDLREAIGSSASTFPKMYIGTCFGYRF